MSTIVRLCGGTCIPSLTGFKSVARRFHSESGLLDIEKLRINVSQLRKDPAETIRIFNSLMQINDDSILKFNNRENRLFMVDLFRDILILLNELNDFNRMYELIDKHIKSVASLDGVFPFQAQIIDAARTYDDFMKCILLLKKLHNYSPLNISSTFFSNLIWNMGYYLHFNLMLDVYFSIRKYYSLPVCMSTVNAVLQSYLRSNRLQDANELFLLMIQGKIFNADSLSIMLYFSMYTGLSDIFLTLFYKIYDSIPELIAQETAGKLDRFIPKPYDNYPIVRTSRSVVYKYLEFMPNADPDLIPVGSLTNFQKPPISFSLLFCLLTLCQDVSKDIEEAEKILCLVCPQKWFELISEHPWLFPFFIKFYTDVGKLEKAEKLMQYYEKNKRDNSYSKYCMHMVNGYTYLSDDDNAEKWLSKFELTHSAFGKNDKLLASISKLLLRKKNFSKIQSLFSDIVLFYKNNPQHFRNVRVCSSLLSDHLISCMMLNQMNIGLKNLTEFLEKPPKFIKILLAKSLLVTSKYEPELHDYVKDFLNDYTNISADSINAGSATYKETFDLNQLESLREYSTIPCSTFISDAVLFSNLRKDPSQVIKSLGYRSKNPNFKFISSNLSQQSSLFEHFSKKLI